MKGLEELGDAGAREWKRKEGLKGENGKEGMGFGVALGRP